MNQPPTNHQGDHAPPQWCRPRGVAPGTWDYVHQRAIADHYDDFVADTPLCSLDDQIIRQTLPGFTKQDVSRTGDVPTSEVVLDLGCGTGRAALPLAQRGYEVVAIDLSRSMLQAVNRKVASHEIGDCLHVVQANLVELDCFRDQVADHAICMFSTLGMISGRENRRRMLRHVARIVRPGGKLIVHVHNRWAALSEVGGVCRLIRSWWRSRRHCHCEFGDAVYSYRGLDKMFMHRYSRRELVNDLETCGWQVDTVHRVSIDGSSLVLKGNRIGGYIVVTMRTAIEMDAESLSIGET